MTGLVIFRTEDATRVSLAASNALGVRTPPPEHFLHLQELAPRDLAVLYFAPMAEELVSPLPGVLALPLWPDYLPPELRRPLERTALTLRATLYQRPVEPNLPVCVYCGELATTRDHIPPRAGRGLAVNSSKEMDVGTFPACLDCNSVLGEAPLYTIRERKRYLWERLSLKGSKTKSWTPEALSQLGESLRGRVRAGEALGAQVLRRLEVLADQSRLYPPPTSPAPRLPPISSGFGLFPPPPSPPFPASPGFTPSEAPPAYGAGRFAPGVALIVGERSGVARKGQLKNRLPFVTFAGDGIGPWLCRQLEFAQVPEDDLYWINAYDVDGAATEFSVVKELKPRVIFSLGPLASRWCVDAGVSYVETLSPQEWRQQKRNQKYPLGELIRSVR